MHRNSAYSLSGHITIPDSVTYPNTYVKYCVVKVEERAFTGSNDLTGITLPSSVTSIGNYAFSGCTNLTNINIPNSVPSIGQSTFENCSSLTNIVIPNNVTTIEANAFKNCSSLANIEIPSSVTSIGESAFSGCTNLTNIVIPNNVTTIRANAFKNCSSLTSVTIGAAVSDIGSKVFEGCTNLTSITVDANNPYYDSRDNCNAIIIKQPPTRYDDENTLIVGCKGTTIPNSVTIIGASAFYGCKGLTSIDIPSSVTDIYSDAFTECNNLKTIIFHRDTPPGIPYYGSLTAFGQIYYLATFYVPNNSYERGNGWSTLNSRYTFVVGNFKPLYTNRWNFVAGLDNQAGLYNSNTPENQDQHCDIAIVGYDYSENKWGENNYLYVNDNMTKGAGYFVWPFTENTQGTTITTEGTITIVNMPYLTSGSVMLNQTNNGTAIGGAKWFAFGNPFNMQLTKTEILNVLQNVQSDVLYTYNAYNGTWNNNATVVLPGQGFMVASANNQTAVSGTINYPSNSNPLPAQENYGIRFSVNANDLISNIYAKQENSCQDGFDTQDAYALFGNNENLVEPYFVVEGRQIIHNRYNSDNYACEINFHAQKSGVAELSVSDVPEGTIVSIVDLAMNEETVLDSEPYQIEVEAGENAGRYQIKINKSSVSLPQTIANQTNISIWNNNREIFVKGENLQRVEVYNTIGQKVYQREISGEAYNFTFDNEGAYIVKVTSENGIKSHKIQVLPAL